MASNDLLADQDASRWTLDWGESLQIGDCPSTIALSDRFEIKWAGGAKMDPTNQFALDMIPKIEAISCLASLSSFLSLYQEKEIRAVSLMAPGHSTSFSLPYHLHHHHPSPVRPSLRAHHSPTKWYYQVSQPRNCPSVPTKTVISTQPTAQHLSACTTTPLHTTLRLVD